MYNVHREEEEEGREKGRKEEEKKKTEPQSTTPSEEEDFFFLRVHFLTHQLFTCRMVRPVSCASCFFCSSDG
jgi:hypothetical protein